MKLLSIRRLFCAALVGVFAFSLAPSADARPAYNKRFKELYEGNFGDDVKLKCDICHGKSKKKRSEYADAVWKEMGEDAKNVKDNDKIDAALKAAEALPSQTEGKTYGELIADGVLPAPYTE